MTLVRRLFSSNTNNRDSTQGSFPDYFPGVSSASKTNFTSGPVCTLCYGVSMKGKSVWFHVNISRTVVRIPCMIKCAKFGFISRDRREELGSECFFCKFPDTMHSPDIVVLVIQEPVPVLTNWILNILKYHWEALNRWNNRYRNRNQGGRGRWGWVVISKEKNGGLGFHNENHFMIIVIIITTIILAVSRP